MPPLIATQAAQAADSAISARMALPMTVRSLDAVATGTRRDARWDSRFYSRRLLLCAAKPGNGLLESLLERDVRLVAEQTARLIDVGLRIAHVARARFGVDRLDADTGQVS